ncbi:IclR family transcriptional regulator [Amycolatopsis pithecellobii]|uniref:Glycerol operon regulatory protein n=1 Tax=Amycolatopsis pithecellobii TaxID=664692 RepID=A0A6N7YUS2_9PSEU|nr:IclR family transcriptional regulator [Amycolatopsis pithecellobii]MTD55668.1 helix-turn-helix domain-containing protein [Amycolatopsis pithecellobii]
MMSKSEFTPMVVVEDATSDVDRGSSSAAKALAILDAFSGPRAILGVTELARAIGVPKSTVHRLLAVMIRSGYICKVEGRYSLTERVFELGNRVGSGALRASGLRHHAMPFMSGLYASTRETVHLATLAGTEVLYLEKVFGHGGARCTTAVGSRRPAYATALGKAILAYSSDAVVERTLRGPFRQLTGRTVRAPAALLRKLAEVRTSGLATDHGEVQAGMCCVAAPIRDPRTRRAVAAVSICSLATRNLESKYGHAVVDIARDLSRVALAGPVPLD